MALMQKSDLIHEYSWKAQSGDNPKIVGFPDSHLLNRTEGYEVLDFINRYAEKHSLKQKASGSKIEKMIKSYLPGDVRSHKNVEAWITSHWKQY